MDQFARLVADDMDAQDDVAFCIDDQLGEEAALAADKGLLHGAKLCRIDIVHDAFGLGFVLAQTDRADLRLRKHGGRDVFIIEHRRVVIKGGLNEGMGFTDGDRGQVHAIGDIADGVDVRMDGARPGIDRDGAVHVRRNADDVEAETFGLWLAAGGVQDFMGFHGRSVIQRNQFDIAALGQLDGIEVGADVDAALLHLGCQVVAHLVIETAQDLFAAI